MLLADEEALCMRFLFAPPLAGKDEQLTQGAADETRVGSGGAASPARQVMNADFPIGAGGTFHLVKQFGIDHRSPRFERVLVQKVGAQEFKGTINVADVNVQHPANQALPAP